MNIFKKLSLIFLLGFSILAQAESISLVAENSLIDSNKGIITNEAINFDVSLRGNIFRNPALDLRVLNWDRFNISPSNIINNTSLNNSSITLNRSSELPNTKMIGNLNIRDNNKIVLNYNTGLVFSDESVINPKLLSGQSVGGLISLWTITSEVNIGTGIRSIIIDPSISGNELVLMAPNGVIDSGDAGIVANGTLVFAVSEVPLPFSVYLFLSALGLLSFYKKRNC